MSAACMMVYGFEACENEPASRTLLFLSMGVCPNLARLRRDSTSSSSSSSDSKWGVLTTGEERVGLLALPVLRTSLGSLLGCREVDREGVRDLLVPLGFGRPFLPNLTVDLEVVVGLDKVSEGFDGTVFAVVPVYINFEKSLGLFAKTKGARGLGLESAIVCQVVFVV